MYGAVDRVRRTIGNCGEPLRRSGARLLGRDQNNLVGRGRVQASDSRDNIQDGFRRTVKHHQSRMADRPITATWRLRYSSTNTEACGLYMNFSSFMLSSLASPASVTPPACTTPTSGSSMLPCAETLTLFA